MYAPGGWWSYEWCHRKVVRQFHREADGSMNPVWSLGEFDSQDRVTTVTPKYADSGYYHSYHYIDGQVCGGTVTVPSHLPLATLTQTHA